MVGHHMATEELAMNQFAALLVEGSSASVSLSLDPAPGARVVKLILRHSPR